MKNKLLKSLLLMSLSTTLMFGMTGCAAGIKSEISQVKGKLIGNSYTVETFDNFGNSVLTVTGDKISVTPNIVSDLSWDSSQEAWVTKETLSSVITMYVDGNELTSCGDTCIFMGEGLEPEYQWNISEINSNAEGITSNAAIASMVNKVKNFFGKSQVIVVKSQTGFPIYAFSGEDVTWDIPNDLPKFTILMVDGKPLYIHRANFQIIDKDLLD